MNDAAQQAALARVAEMHYDALRTAMGGLQKKERALRLNLDQLINDRNTSAHALKDGAFASVAVADIRWQQWVEQRRAVINTELATVLAKQIELRVQLKKAFAKKLAAEAICAQTVQIQRQTNARRAAYES